MSRKGPDPAAWQGVNSSNVRGVLQAPGGGRSDRTRCTRGCDTLSVPACPPSQLQQFLSRVGQMFSVMPVKPSTTAFTTASASAAGSSDIIGSVIIIGATAAGAVTAGKTLRGS